MEVKSLKHLSLILISVVCLLVLIGAAQGETVFQMDDKNAGVSLLQAELQQLGYLQSEPDGVYGMDTQMAVSVFNKDHGLETGEGTDWATCEALWREINGDVTLHAGDKCSLAYAVQKLLCSMGFLDSSPDGAFGNQSMQAMKLYMAYAAENAAAFMQEREDARALSLVDIQAESDMPVAYDMPLINTETILTDGTVTEDWLAFMTSDLARAGKEISTDSDKSEVKRLQRRLKALKYYAGRIDGDYGEHTILALKYFQRLNGLKEDGKCDALTQSALFSDDATPSDQYVAPYMAWVSRELNQVKIMGWTGAGYTELVKTFSCSTGKKGTPTIEGTFQAVGQISEWYYMPASHVWVRYAFQIYENYFFHSVLYHAKGSTHPTSSSVRNIGKSVSHGCIRMMDEDIQWIYENCTPGMTVTII